MNDESVMERKNSILKKLFKGWKIPQFMQKEIMTAIIQSNLDTTYKLASWLLIWSGKLENMANELLDYYRDNWHHVECSCDLCEYEKYKRGDFPYDES